MKSLAVKFIAAFFAFSLLNSPLHCQNTPDYNRIDSLMSLLESKDKFMGAVAVNIGGRQVYSNAFGFSDVEKQIKATSKTTYRIGSVSKMFTSVMIYQLFEEQKLQPDTRLSAFYPEIQNADKITIRDMLLHRSGIRSVTDDSLYLEWCVKPRTHAEIVSMITSYTPVFQPDEKSEYSNSNFILLGYILENLTDKDYSSNLEERICRKAGLKTTYYGKPANTLKNESYSYSFDGINWLKENETDMSIPHGAGAVVSTAEDLVVFSDALFAGKLISESSLQDMTKAEGTYGKGIFPMPFYEMKGFGHTGGIDGFRSVLIHFPSENLSLALCSNAMNYNQNEILIGILSIIEGKEYKMPVFTTTVLSADHLKQFEGIYSSESFPLKLTVKAEGSVLTAQATGQSAFPLEAVNETEFKFDAAGIRIIFLDGEQLNIKQGGMDIIMKKEKQ